VEVIKLYGIKKGQAWIPEKLRETRKQGTRKTMEAGYEEQGF